MVSGWLDKSGYSAAGVEQDALLDDLGGFCAFTG